MDARNGNGTRILVVDDEPSIVDAVSTALRYEGYAVEEASTGLEALEAIATDEPDLVILDWMLPDIEGIEVGPRLRARGFRTAVLFLTAKDTAPAVAPAARPVRADRARRTSSRVAREEAGRFVQRSLRLPRPIAH